MAGTKVRFPLWREHVRASNTRGRAAGASLVGSFLSFSIYVVYTYFLSLYPTFSFVLFVPSPAILFCLWVDTRKSHLEIPYGDTWRHIRKHINGQVPGHTAEHTPRQPSGMPSGIPGIHLDAPRYIHPGMDAHGWTCGQVPSGRGSGTNANANAI